MIVSPVVVPPGDTVKPFVRFVFPLSDGGLYDRDSNGLLDLEVAWGDSAGAVDPASARVECHKDCVPGAPLDGNLANGWRIQRRDTAGMVLEETVPLLLRGGDHELTLKVTVADTAGNRSPPAVVTLRLPPGAFNRVIDLGSNPPCNMERGVSIALSGDEKKGLVGFHGCIAIFNTDGEPQVRFVTSGPLEYGSARVDTSTGLAWFLQDGIMAVVDVRSEQLVRSSMHFGYAWDVAFLGGQMLVGDECSIFLVDKFTLSLSDTISLAGAPTGGQSCPTASRIEMASDHRTGWAVLLAGGIVRFDVPTRTMVASYLGPSSIYSGEEARGLAVGHDGRVYLTRPGIGLLEEYDPNPWRLVTAATGSPVSVDLALSPDGGTLFTSTWTSAGSPPPDYISYVSTPRLYDVPNLRLRYQYPPRSGRLTDGVAFSADGKRAFLMALDEVHVYLVRPR